VWQSFCSACFGLRQRAPGPSPSAEGRKPGQPTSCLQPHAWHPAGDTNPTNHPSATRRLRRETQLPTAMDNAPRVSTHQLRKFEQQYVDACAERDFVLRALFPVPVHVALPEILPFAPVQAVPHVWTFRNCMSQTTHSKEQYARFLLSWFSGRRCRCAARIFAARISCRCSRRRGRYYI
jgi:hypothetical protein